MPKLVCVQCEVELKPSVNGVVVVEMASFGPYKVWAADEWVCPGCGFKIAAGFADQPTRQDHCAVGFPAWLENEIKWASKYSKVIYDYEEPCGQKD